MTKDNGDGLNSQPFEYPASNSLIQSAPEAGYTKRLKQSGHQRALAGAEFAGAKQIRPKNSRSFIGLYIYL